MGLFINKGNNAFLRIRKTEYVDKSGLIALVNQTLFTEHCFSCISRCRRFGKSMAAKMLCAYYDHSCDSRSLFTDLEIASDASFEEHLNKYPVIYLDMTDFIARFKEDHIVETIDEALRDDIRKAYPDVPAKEDDDLMDFLLRVAAKTGQYFVFIIDEWDALLREYASYPNPKDSNPTDDYVRWLRRMFKSASGLDVFAGVYMTGILPIKKYPTQSALNNFIEYSMVEPMNMGQYFGFTKQEVQMLAQRHNIDFDELEKWYDGYQIGDQLSMFNPNSVMMAVRSGRCRSYWASTGSFDAVSHYIKMNYDGLKDDVINMLAGGRVKVNTTKFQNDLSEVRGRDDVLTVLLHLGYLSLDWRKNECYVPNYEVREELANAIESSGWTDIARSLQQSEQLLQATLDDNAAEVARMVDAAHDENTSILSYNNENSLACVLSIAYYYAHGDYIFHREFPSGKGYADLVLLPRKNVETPAIILELKYGDSVNTALDQIRRRDYPAKIAQYTGALLLVGISYDRENKTHACQIEAWEK